MMQQGIDFYSLSATPMVTLSMDRQDCTTPAYSWRRTAPWRGNIPRCTAHPNPCEEKIDQARTSNQFPDIQTLTPLLPPISQKMAKFQVDSADHLPP